MGNLLSEPKTNERKVRQLTEPKTQLPKNGDNIKPFLFENIESLEEYVKLMLEELESVTSAKKKCLNTQTRLDRKIKITSKDLENANRLYQECDASYKNLKYQLSQLETRESDLKKIISNLQGRRVPQSRAKQVLKTTQNDLDALRSRIDSFENEKIILNNAIQKTRKSNKQLLQANRQLKKRLNDLQGIPQVRGGKDIALLKSKLELAEKKAAEALEGATQTEEKWRQAQKDYRESKTKQSNDRRKLTELQAKLESREQDLQKQEEYLRERIQKEYQALVEKGELPAQPQHFKSLAAQQRLLDQSAESLLQEIDKNPELKGQFEQVITPFIQERALKNLLDEDVPTFLQKVAGDPELLEQFQGVFKAFSTQEE